jgi:hypothetical protein
MSPGDLPSGMERGPEKHALAEMSDPLGHDQVCHGMSILRQQDRHHQYDQRIGACRQPDPGDEPAGQGMRPRQAYDKNGRLDCNRHQVAGDQKVPEVSKVHNAGSCLPVFSGV